jgi:UDP-N-acetylmuramoyl-L-alanyl-D-glutamate--2,6-diaminopimelate ligase
VLLHDLLDGADVVVRGGTDVDVASVVSDSREVRAGALFACIPGHVTDGHRFAGDAVARGAVALLVEHPVEVDGAVPQVEVRSVRAAVGPLAARALGDPSRHMRVLGVTGTNGKTTTAYLIDAVGRGAGERTGMIGTVETRIGDATSVPRHTTPEASDLQALFAEMRAAGVTAVAMEVSSHALDQHRVDGTAFAAVCFTNLSHDHLDYHGDLDAYFEAKARLFVTRFSEHAAINVDDAHGALLAERARSAGVDVLTYSRRHGDLHATHVNLARDHTDLTLRWPDGETTALTTMLVGPFNVENTIAAAATAAVAGFARADIVAGLSAPIAVPGRMERVDAGQDFTVIVDYAHTPDALERVLVASRSLAAPAGRLIAVYGCGGDRDRAKRPLMGAAAARHADIAVLTSDNPRSEAPEAIAADVLAGVGATPPHVELDRRKAIHWALATAEPGDVVLIAGKGHERGQTVGAEVRPFDDCVVAREELETLVCG